MELTRATSGSPGTVTGGPRNAGTGQASTSAIHADHMLPIGLPDISSATHHQQSVIQQRYHQLVDPWGPSELYFVTSHRLVRRHKVYLNVYHLVKPKTNKRLTRIGLGGAYHSAIELQGTEHAFGGHYDKTKGIYEMRPGMWQQRKQELDKLEQMGLTKKELKEKKEENLAMLPPLKDRLVIGTWTGSTLEWERIIGQLQMYWQGPQYRLLSKNCNNFVGHLFEVVNNHRHFDVVPGVSAKSFEYLYKLPKKATSLCCCIPCLADTLDEPMMPAPYSVDVFRGRPRKLNEGPRVITPLMARLNIDNRPYDPPDGDRPRVQSPVWIQNLSADDRSLTETEEMVSAGEEEEVAADGIVPEVLDEKERNTGDPQAIPDRG